MSSSFYSQKFYARQQDGSLQSAMHTLPHLLKHVTPRTVADIGCGVGTWLAAMQTLNPGCKVLGIDGDYVNREMLKISAEDFLAADLKKPIKLETKFDMAMCLEVGEHLPQSSSQVLVDSLTDLSDIILFSAAIPLQGGTDHINEQMPEFWATRFVEKGYVCCDIIRKEIWNNDQILFPYRQNILLFVKRELISKYPLLNESGQKTDSEFLFRVHPYVYFHRSQKELYLNSWKNILKYKAYIIKQKWKRYLKR